MPRAVCLPAHFLSAFHPAARLICLAHSSAPGWLCFPPGRGVSLPEGHGSRSSFTCHSRLSTTESLLTSPNLIFHSPSPGTPRVLYKTPLPLHSTLHVFAGAVFSACNALAPLSFFHSSFARLTPLSPFIGSGALEEVFHFSPTTDLRFLKHLCHISVVEFRIRA